MFGVLNVGVEKISDKAIKSVEERVTSVTRHSSASKKHVYDSLVWGFTHGKEWGFGKCSEGELEEAEELAKRRYSSRDWNFMR